MSFRDKPVIISWVDATSNHARYLCQTVAIKDPSQKVTLSFDCNDDGRTKTALFRVRVPIQVKGTGKNMALLLHIHPEQIVWATRPALDFQPAAVTRNLGDDTVCLHLQLSKGPDLIVPKGDVIPLKQKPHGQMLEDAKELSQQTTLDVYLPRCVLSDARAKRLADIVKDSEVQSAFRARDLSSMFMGKGARIWSPDSKDNGDTDKETPPHYDEAGPAPPVSPLGKGTHDENPKKRRRQNSDGDKITPEETTNNLIIFEAVEKIRQELKTSNADLMARINQRFEQTQVEITSLREENRQLRNQLNTLEVYDQTQIDNMFYEQSCEMEASLSLKVDDDEVDNLKLDLQDMVRDEIKEQGKKIKRHIKKSLRFNSEPAWERDSSDNTQSDS